MTGKGGVGKTTVAYALGLAAVKAGKRAIVCEIAAQERGSRIFGKTPVGFHEVEMSDGLWAISIDFEPATKEYLEDHMPVRSMGSILARSNIFGYLAAATPGLQEIVAMGKVWELANQKHRSDAGERVYDTVIVDAPATGHGITFLQAPGDFRDLTRVGPLSKQASRIEQTLADGSITGVVIVARPEEMAVNEAIHLEEALAGPDAGTRFAIDQLYVNALYPSRFTAAELDLLEKLAAGGEAGEPPSLPALDAALAEAARSATQHEQLERLREAVSGPIVELPFIPEPEIGRDQLAVLAESVS